MARFEVYEIFKFISNFLYPVYYSYLIEYYMGRRQNFGQSEW